MPARPPHWPCSPHPSAATALTAGKTAEPLSPLQSLPSRHWTYSPPIILLPTCGYTTLSQQPGRTGRSHTGQSALFIPRPAPPSPACTCSDSCANSPRKHTRTPNRLTRVHTPAHLCPRTHSPNRNVAPLSLLLTPDRGPVPGKLQLFRRSLFS